MPKEGEREEGSYVKEKKRSKNMQVAMNRNDNTMINKRRNGSEGNGNNNNGSINNTRNIVRYNNTNDVRNRDSNRYSNEVSIFNNMMMDEFNMMNRSFDMMSRSFDAMHRNFGLSLFDNGFGS
uniref:Uncharacterized protein n=1 Tax=Lygus hesperus TaxID=30085 RepID=A0A0A9WVG0_LYGHE